jgi:hypothetical protein
MIVKIHAEEAAYSMVVCWYDRAADVEEVKEILLLKKSQAAQTQQTKKLNNKK